MWIIFIGALEEGLAYAVMALGVYITYKILDFPDLSVDGTFPLGAAITAVLITKGVSPVLTLLISFVIGAFAGMLTGIIHVKFKVRDLLAGIIMMTALYSINLRITGGKADVPIFTKKTIFNNSFLNKMPEVVQPYLISAVLLLIVILMKVLLDLYLKTKSGYLLQAVGDNEMVVTSLAKDKGIIKIIGLAIANAFVALSGGVYAQKSGFFNIYSGTGTMVMGLASVVIGINLFKRVSFLKTTTAVVLGSIIYKICVAIAIRYGLETSDLKLITAVLFFIILVASNDRKRRAKGNA
ncbi:MAG: ABC transporter permease [Lachnospiraceae bacterium]|nr:ABC transporter permease [Lachnospiraceae bacterium]